MSLYLDTSAIYAVIDTQDVMHRPASETWDRLLSDLAPLHASNYIVLETITLLQRRIGLDAVRRFTTDILPIIAVFWVDEDIHRAAHHALLVAGRRQVSLVDCVSFEVMRRLDLDRVFCFDPHFAGQGFTVVPTA